MKGLKSKRLVDAREALELIVIDDAKKIVEAMMGRKQRGFPIAALVPFAVARNDDRAPVLRLALGCERFSGSEWQAVPECAVENSAPGTLWLMCAMRGDPSVP